MSEPIQQLAERVDQTLALVEQLKAENGGLKDELAELRTQLTTLRKEHKRLQVANNEQAQTARTRLTGVLNRLDQLEQMTS